MLVIAGKDLKAWFSSLIGYVSIALIWMMFGYYYYMVFMYGSSSYVPNVFRAMFTWCMMIIPIITMRSFSEETKNRTDQALLTAPVSIPSVVFGKFLSCTGVFSLMLLGGLWPCLALSVIGRPDFRTVAANLIGAFLYGIAMISIGVFISSLTSSQIIAAVGTLTVSIFLMILDSSTRIAGSSVVGKLAGWISFNNRYTPFVQGLLSLSNVVFFVSVAAVFLFLTVRKIESRRWD